MYLSKATMVYGLTIRSASLVFASDAWTRLAEPFSFIDLILLRRRSSSLASTSQVGKGAVMRVPEEVWEEIRFCLVQEEIAESEDRVLHDLEGDFSDDEDREKARESNLGRARKSWESLRSGVLLERGSEVYYDWICENISDWAPERFSAISSMVTHFGLALGSQTPISEDAWYDPDAFALVIAPSRFRKGEPSIPIVSATCGGTRRPDQHTIVNVSVKLPKNVDRRFVRLVRLFQLDVTESAINEILVPKKEIKGTEKKRRKSPKPVNGAGNEITNKIEPKWILWTTCEGH
ncbi:hypothetical protein JCM16303_004226 [Sporobolomyces ruberrimus]